MSNFVFGKGKLIIRNTKKYGRGVFASKNIAKGEMIYILSGERMDIKDLVSRVNSDKENIDDPFQIGKRTYIDLDEESRTFNHSCEPNAGIRNTSDLFALRDIKKGEEITYDYSLTIAPTTWKMKCSCNSTICRKILGDVRTIKSPRLKFYQKLGAIQRYMKAIIKQLKAGVYKIPDYEKNALNNLKKTSDFK